MAQPGLALPDAEGVLRPAAQLHYNDAAWLSPEGVCLAHPALPHATAEALGVRSLRHARSTQVGTGGVAHIPGHSTADRGPPGPRRNTESQSQVAIDTYEPQLS